MPEIRTLPCCLFDIDIKKRSFLTSCVFWFVFLNASSHLCFRFFFNLKCHSFLMHLKGYTMFVIPINRNRLTSTCCKNLNKHVMIPNLQTTTWNYFFDTSQRSPKEQLRNTWEWRHWRWRTSSISFSLALTSSFCAGHVLPPQTCRWGRAVRTHTASERPASISVLPSRLEKPHTITWTVTLTYLIPAG